MKLNLVDVRTANSKNNIYETAIFSLGLSSLDVSSMYQKCKTEEQKLKIINKILKKMLICVIQQRIKKTPIKMLRVMITIKQLRNIWEVFDTDAQNELMYIIAENIAEPNFTLNEIVDKAALFMQSNE